MSLSISTEAYTDGLIFIITFYTIFYSCITNLEAVSFSKALLKNNGDLVFY